MRLETLLSWCSLDATRERYVVYRNVCQFLHLTLTRTLTHLTLYYTPYQTFQNMHALVILTLALTYSSKLKVLVKLFSWKSVSFLEQIMSTRQVMKIPTHIFLHQMEIILYKFVSRLKCTEDRLTFISRQCYFN